jgi:beta-lactamase class A
VRIVDPLVKLEIRRTCAAIATVTRFLIVFLFAARAASAQQRSSLPSSIAETVQQRIAKSGADIGIVLERLDGSLRWSLNGDEPFHAASTMKIPVMMELFHQAHARKLKLDDPLLVKNEFHSIVDGSAYQLNPADDSETELYKAVGQARTLTQLCVLMISVSSNLATNLLIEKLGVQNIRATIHEFGADGMNVLRGVEDQKAFDKGLNNTTSARGLAVLLETLAKGRAFDPESSRQMVAILQQQSFNEDGHPNSSQDRGDHQNSPRCRYRLHAEAIRAGDPGPRNGKLQAKFGADCRPDPAALPGHAINTSSGRSTTSKHQRQFAEMRRPVSGLQSRQRGRQRVRAVRRKFEHRSSRGE